MNLENVPMVEVSQDKWADLTSDFRTYATESISGNESVMYCKLAQGQHVGEVISEVHYAADGSRKYFVLKTLDDGREGLK